MSDNIYVDVFGATDSLDAIGNLLNKYAQSLSENESVFFDLLSKLQSAAKCLENDRIDLQNAEIDLQMCMMKIKTKESQIAELRRQVQDAEPPAKQILEKQIQELQMVLEYEKQEYDRDYKDFLHRKELNDRRTMQCSQYNYWLTNVMKSMNSSSQTLTDGSNGFMISIKKIKNHLNDIGKTE